MGAQYGGAAAFVLNHFHCDGVHLLASEHVLPLLLLAYGLAVGTCLLT